MDEERKIESAENEEPLYRPRPAWQVWGARIALALFIGIVIMSYINIARGGL